MIIQVLGSGCPTCKKLYDLTTQAVKELQLSAAVEYITDVQKIVDIGIMRSPVLAIDNQPILAGTVPDVEKIKQVIQSNIK